ncbi:hypothetical protein PRZ61_15000 [Halomonas pacifica]|uniref:hypothetical protein n=1 Tax=Bisbaumannia pacifica TaxID=77098 RepID=UPI002359AE00|nr:hypothetical protein [Halomonas pacifica]MDC8804759.1 hypothetical protein [Halomonas pacifica]
MTANSERLSILVGLLAVMLGTLPRYLYGGHRSQLLLLSLAAVAVALVAASHWRLLAAEARGEVPALLRRLGIGLGVGLALMGAWYAPSQGWVAWPRLLSHGLTLGLLLHVMGLWWKRESA